MLIQFAPKGIQPGRGQMSETFKLNCGHGDGRGRGRRRATFLRDMCIALTACNTKMFLLRPNGAIKTFALQKHCQVA